MAQIDTSSYRCVQLIGGRKNGTGRGRMCEQPADFLLRPGGLAFCSEHETQARRLAGEMSRVLHKIERNDSGAFVRLSKVKTTTSVQGDQDNG
jgi:hypothetical protein